MNNQIQSPGYFLNISPSHSQRPSSMQNRSLSPEQSQFQNNQQIYDQNLIQIQNELENQQVSYNNQQQTFEYEQNQFSDQNSSQKLDCDSQISMFEVDQISKKLKPIDKISNLQEFEDQDQEMIHNEEYEYFQNFDQNSFPNQNQNENSLMFKTPQIQEQLSYERINQTNDQIKFQNCNDYMNQDTFYNYDKQSFDNNCELLDQSPDKMLILNGYPFKNQSIIAANQNNAEFTNKFQTEDLEQLNNFTLIENLQKLESSQSDHLALNSSIITSERGRLQNQQSCDQFNQIQNSNNELFSESQSEYKNYNQLVQVSSSYRNQQETKVIKKLQPRNIQFNYESEMQPLTTKNKQNQLEKGIPERLIVLCKVNYNFFTKHKYGIRSKQKLLINLLAYYKNLKNGGVVQEKEKQIYENYKPNDVFNSIIDSYVQKDVELFVKQLKDQLALCKNKIQDIYQNPFVTKAAVKIFKDLNKR